MIKVGVRIFSACFASVLISCGGGGGGGNDGNAIVPPAPSITSFTASKSAITVGETTTLTAVFANGAGTIDNNVGVVNSGVPIVISPTVTTTYVLKVINDQGSSVTKTVAVTVVKAPSITSFTASKSAITVGETTTLTAVFANGAGTIDNNVGVVNSGVPIAVAPRITTTYELIAVNDCGTSTNAFITVSVSDVPNIKSFVAVSSKITSGDKVALSWDILGASSVTIDQGIGQVSGNSCDVQPTETTKYTITASNSSGESTTANLTIQVVEKPVVHDFNISPKIPRDSGSVIVKAVFTGVSACINPGGYTVSSGQELSINCNAMAIFELSVFNELGYRVTKKAYAYPSNYLAAGYTDSYALLRNGKIMHVGNYSSNPTPEFYDAPVNATNITSQLSNCMIRCSDGTVWEVGSGTTMVDGINNVIAISSGWRHTLALKNDGTVWAWGDNTSGQLGDGLGKGIPITTPFQVPGLPKIVAVSAGAWHSLALDENGRLWGWGDNSLGELGDGTKTNRLIPGLISTVDQVSSLSTGAYTSGVLLLNGSIKGCGEYPGSVVYSLQFEDVNIPASSPVVGLSNSGWHTMALLSDNSIWAWGTTLSVVEMLGDGSGKTALLPVNVIDIQSVIEVSAGGYHSIAVSADGGFWGWGVNINGRIGDGTCYSKPTPVRSSLINIW